MKKLLAAVAAVAIFAGDAIRTATVPRSKRSPRQK